MIKSKKKNSGKLFKALYAVICLAVIIFAFALNMVEVDKQDFTSSESAYEYEFIDGEIKNVNGDADTGIRYEVDANSGEEDGELIYVESSTSNEVNDYAEGDEILIYKSTHIESGEINYTVADYYHQNGLYVIFAIFALATIAIARKKGFTAILSVAVSILLFYFVFLKLVVLGYSPLMACLLFVSAVTVITIPFIHGFNKKSASSLVAIIVGYLISLSITYIFKDIAQLGLTPGEDFRVLHVMFPGVQLADILIVSLFMGAVGALIDTAISVSSAIFEAIEGHPRQTIVKVYKTGMQVGKDVIGSMINTLLFAYLASALPFLVVLALGQNSSISELINMDFIALELTRTFIGAISLVVLIPIVAALSAYMFMRKS